MPRRTDKKHWGHWAMGLLILGAGCGPHLEGQQEASAPRESISQARQGLATVQKTLSWDAISPNKNCNFSTTTGLNAEGNQAPRNGYASGRKEESFTLSGLAGLRISSMKLTSSDPNFAYDDVVLLTYNDRLVMASDQRVARYSNGGITPTTSSTVLYDWSKIRNQDITNQNLQLPWCSSGASSCTVPETESPGAVNVDIANFSTLDNAAYPLATKERTFKFVTIGDNDDGSYNSGYQTLDTDCVHGALSLTVSVSGAPIYTSCSAIKAADPSATSGVYWIQDAAGNPKRVYCSFTSTSAQELCREGLDQEVTVTTREGSNLAVKMMTRLLPSRDTCEIWNVRSSSDNMPLSALTTASTMGSCQALGFLGDGQMGICPYGSSYGDCGYSTAQLYVYGNTCAGCSLNDGTFSNYVKQGPVTTGTILSNVSGSIRSSCRVAPTACERSPSQCGKSSDKAASGCAHLKAVNPSAPDGIYWIDSSQGPLQTYCKSTAELCSTVEATRAGVAPMGPGGTAGMYYWAQTRLDASNKTCSLWAIRHAGDGYPLGPLYLVGGNTLSTCQALGFSANVSLGSCGFGLNYGKCGFSVTDYYLYGNSCSGCQVNDGSFAGYMKQGPIYNGSILSNVSGTITTTCQVP